MWGHRNGQQEYKKESKLIPILFSGNMQKKLNYRYKIETCLHFSPMILYCNMPLYKNKLISLSLIIAITQ